MTHEFITQAFKLSMQFTVMRTADYQQIVGIIVLLIAVYMMYDFATDQKTANLLFGNQDVLVNVLRYTPWSWGIDHQVTPLITILPTTPTAMLRSATLKALSQWRLSMPYSVFPQGLMTNTQFTPYRTERFTLAQSAFKFSYTDCDSVHGTIIS